MTVEVSLYAVPLLQVAAPDGVPHLDAASGAIEGLATRPGLAMSQDARNWARIEGDHHSGALFDVGKPGEWDELMVAAPQASRQCCLPLLVNR